MSKKTAEEFFIPKLGQTVESVTLVKWLVEDGAKVSLGQELMEVETDKAIFPVEANAKGYLHIGPYKEGDVLPVLTVVAIIGKAEDRFGAAQTAAGEESTAGAETTAPAEAAPAPVAEQPLAASGAEQPFASPRARKLAAEKGVALAQVTPSGYGGQRVVERDVVGFLAALPKATPVAQKMAAATGVDLRTVTGTGPGGKIVKEDVARAQPAPAIQEEPTPALPGREGEEPTLALPGREGERPTPARPAREGERPTPALPGREGEEVVERVAVKGVRAIIAERMGNSVHTTARVTLFMEADATELVAARERLKAKVSEAWGFAPGYNDLLAKITAAALRQFPYMNARLSGAPGKAPEAIEIMAHVNIGMAVDTERGLLVPVLRNVDQKNLRQLGSEFRTMVERARKGRSLPDDLSGGTFTITNLGMYEVDSFTPVINLPEAAILGVGRIAPKVVPYKGEVAIRQMWTLCLVFDHRLVDGAPAARFLQAIKQMIEEPYLLLAA